MNLQERINNIELGRFNLIRYKYGVIRNVRFNKTKTLKWNHYEAIDN
jgi:hypothetical protein